MTYKLDKRLWDNTDYGQMGWHDCRIYKIRLTEDLELDIDYILQWNKPEVDGLPYTFWLAPSTLVFKNVKDMIFDLNIATGEPIEIDDVEKIETETHDLWTIETHQGFVEFKCKEYQQFIRQDPFFQFGQTISVTERYGFSLERTINQTNPNRVSAEILRQRKIDLENYEKAKSRQISRIQKEQLDLDKTSNKVGTKEYLLKKKELLQIIDSFDNDLKDTRFAEW